MIHANDTMTTEHYQRPVKTIQQLLLLHFIFLFALCISAKVNPTQAMFKEESLNLIVSHDFVTS